MHSTTITPYKLKSFSIALVFSVLALQPGHSATDTDRDGVPDNSDKCPDVARGAIVDSNGCYALSFPKPLQGSSDNSNTIDITFASGSSVVSPVFIERLLPIARDIKKRPDTRVTIQGHTDSYGSVQSNLALSTARAKSVAAILVKEYGIPAERIKTIGYGESSPIASNNTRAGRFQNRRVIIITKK